MIDVTTQVAAKQNYEERIKSLLTAQSNILSMCTINLTQDTFEIVHTEKSLMPLLRGTGAFEETMIAAAPSIVGDELLKHVSEQLKLAFRSKDVLVRLGGDEFMVILMDCRYEQGKFIPDKIREINDNLANPEGDIPPTSLSVGVAFSRKGETQELYNRADAALYKVKDSGRCGCCVYEDTFEKDIAIETD